MNEKNEIQKKYQEYMAECGRRKIYEVIQFEDYFYERLSDDQKKSLKKYYQKFKEEKALLQKQGLYFGVVTKVIRRKIQNCHLPIECDLFIRDYPKQYTRKDKRNFYGL